MNGSSTSRALRYAAALALSYGAVAAAYIYVSSNLAAESSASVEELRRIETLKGVVFVAVTALFTFAGAWFAMWRIESAESELRRRERALQVADSRVFAGLMASSVAHDANNVLVTALAEVDELAEGALPSQRESAERLGRAMARLIELNRRLVSVSKSELARDRQPVDLTYAARDCVNDLRSNREVRGCRIEVLGDGEVVVMASTTLIQQLLTNLVLNAAQATGGKGRIEVRVTRADGESIVEVHDDGPGVPPEKRARLFSALETTKREGVGLGLFSVRACVESLGGAVEVDDSPLGGALFRVTLPMDGLPASAPLSKNGPRG